MVVMALVINKNVSLCLALSRLKKYKARQPKKLLITSIRGPYLL